MRRPHEALVVVHRRARQFLVLHRTRRYERYWHVVAGALEADEAPADAALRELEEEIGLDAHGALVDLARRYVYPLSEEPPAVRARFGAHIEEITVDCFAVEALEGWEPRLNDEHDEHRWCSTDEAVALLRWPETHELVRALASLSDPNAPLKERAWSELAAIDAALERGQIDEEGWHRSISDLVVPAYLAADTPWGGSGKTGGEREWERSRRLVVDALDGDGTFLDVGCANGLLMESVARWSPFRTEPYGLEISPELAELARRRLPHWTERIWVGNALGWQSSQRFDVIRTGLEYVPKRRRRQLVEHLLGFCGRLVIGVFVEEREVRRTEELVESWGYGIGGRSERPHRDPRLEYRVFWIGSKGHPAPLRHLRQPA